MEIRETALAGCHTVRTSVHSDRRGTLVKPYLRSAFEEAGLHSDFGELFYSQSFRGVVRGLHYQAPPAGQGKLVSCVAGEVHDVVLDVRVGSPTYGHHLSFSLTADQGLAVYVPVGFAHGFAVVSETATVAYLGTAEYRPGTDGGIRWDSAGVQWPIDSPTVSDRDEALPPLAAFESPFHA